MNTLTTTMNRPVLRIDVQHVHLCMDLQLVMKVLPLAWLERVPGSPSYVAGLLNLAGVSVPVVDLALLLGLPRDASYSLDIPVLLCMHGQQKMGFIVDRISDVVTIDDSTLQIHEEFKKPDSFFVGAISIEETLTLLLDPHQLFRVDKVFPAENVEKDKDVLSHLYGGY